MADMAYKRPPFPILFQGLLKQFMGLSFMSVILSHLQSDFIRLSPLRIPLLQFVERRIFQVDHFSDHMNVEIRIVLEIPVAVQAIERMHVVVGREVHGLHVSITFDYYFVQLYKEIMIFVFSPNFPGQMFHFSCYEKKALDGRPEGCTCK